MQKCKKLNKNGWGGMTGFCLDGRAKKIRLAGSGWGAIGRSGCTVDAHGDPAVDFQPSFILFLTRLFIYCRRTAGADEGGA